MGGQKAGLSEHEAPTRRPALTGRREPMTTGLPRVRGPRDPAAVLALQRRAGNRAVASAVSGRTPAGSRSPDATATAAPGPERVDATRTTEQEAGPALADATAVPQPDAARAPDRWGAPAPGGPAVQRFGEGLLDGLRQRVGAFTGGLRSGWDSLRGRAAGVLERVRHAAGAAVNRVRTLGSELVGGLHRAWSAARTAISGATGRLRQLVGGALAVLRDPIGALRRAVTSLDLGGVGGAVRRLMAVVDGLGGRVSAAGRAVREAVGAAWSRVTGVASAAAQRLSALAASTVDGVRSLAGSLTSGLGAAWSALTARAGRLGSLASGALGFASGLVERLLGGARSLWGGVQGAWGSLSARFGPTTEDAGRQVGGARAAAGATLTEATAQVRAGHESAGQQATGTADRLNSGVSGLVARIRAVPWAGALNRAAEAVPALRQVQSVVRDPEGAAAPHVRQLADKVHDELPGESERVATRHLREAGLGAEATAGPVVQRLDDADARTTDVGSIWGNLRHVFAGKLSGLSAGFLFRAVMQLLKDLVWPIPTVLAELRGLGTDLAAFAGQFFLPRNPLTDALGCLHDVWSNLLTVLDLPIIVVRRLSTAGLALMGWVTLILTVAGAVGGAGAGTLVGGVASALASLGLAAPAGAAAGGAAGGVAGAGAGFGTAMMLGEGLVIAFAAAHAAEVGKSLLDLATARQTPAEKADDYNQAADSVISLAVVGILLALGWLGARLGARIAPVLARVVPPSVALAARQFAAAASRRAPAAGDPLRRSAPPVRDPNPPVRRPAPEPEPGPVPEPSLLVGWRAKLQLLQSRVGALRRRYASSGAADAAVDAEITQLETSVRGMSDRLQGASRAEELPGFGRDLRNAESTAYDLEQRVDRLVPGPAPTPVQQQLAQRLGMEARTVASYLDDAQCQRVLDLIDARAIVGDRLAGLRNFVQEYNARGRSPGKLMELLDTDWPDLRQMLDDRARVSWEPNWRGRPRIENGNADEGWQHIDERHVTGNAPDGAGDLFAPGTTRAEIQAAVEELVASGARVSRPNARMQTFEKRITVHGQSDTVRTTVDAADGRVITAFPVRGGG